MTRPTYADLEALQARKTEINGQILAVEERLAIGKAKYASDGVGNSFVERATMESERARLRRERHEVYASIEAMRATLKPRAQGLMVDELCKSLGAMGLQSIIRDAKARVEEQLGGDANDA